VLLVRKLSGWRPRATRATVVLSIFAALGALAIAAFPNRYGGAYNEALDDQVPGFSAGIFDGSVALLILGLVDLDWQQSAGLACPARHAAPTADRFAGLTLPLMRLPSSLVSKSGRCRSVWGVHPARAHDLRDVRAGVVDADRRGSLRGTVFNDTTKYIVSSTLTNPTWRNSKVIGPNDPETIRTLKDEVDGDLYVSGSGTLVRAMLADGLVDDLHLFVFPLTRGSGPRLFPEDAAPGNFSLAGSNSYDNGVLYLHYRPQR
jgi:dihydrofolate reductase